MIPMALATLTGRYAEDSTGLQGKYDFDLNWTPDANQPAMMEHGIGSEQPQRRRAAPGDSGPSLTKLNA